MKEIDTTQDYEQEEVLHLCLFCTYTLFSSVEGKKVKNYIRISNVLPSPPVFHEFERLNYENEKQDIWVATISTEMPFVYADGRIGKMMDKMAVNLNDLDKEHAKIAIEMLIERILHRKHDLGQHPLPP